ncbi:hypothetical protein SAMN05216319_1506 [Duganella sp. CF402]|uniref:hypothetical protein n=1 Tax=unclassified Duganella TaxID=2636909 RepID=UPI0008ACDA76|nr:MULTISPECIES: hypothetical protein [unclassified Duganella]RZT10045.1 hypothetical protein EV582_2120 [Duganella sp. BK701]SEL30980.1 hypothetical protein SAMN05216319_1506 [Duganella sp. CF402]
MEAPKDGAVIVTTETRVTEKEISEEREGIVLRLHAAYLNLTDQMAEFQSQWDENPTLAFVTSAREGWNAGGAEWLSDQAELFKPELWTDLGGKIRDAAGTAYDRLASYSKQRYDELHKQLSTHIENPDDTLYNWAWWQKAITEEATELGRQQLQKLEDARHAVQDAANTVIESANKARKIYQHRDAILNLPSLIADGQPRPVQNFVDTVLMDIDPVLAKSIRNDPNFAVVLEIIADHDSALSYLAYVGLMIEAIPPNFYAYVAGKGSAYLMIEVVMLVVSALLSAGAAVAARITMLIGRFAAASVKVVTANRRIKRAKAAIDAFLRIMRDLSDAVDDLHNLGAKLLQARSKGLVVRGNTKTTLAAKRTSIKRDKKCRVCGSTAHTTPRLRPGTVHYV